MGLCGSDPPDPADAYVAGLRSDLENLPATRQIEALSLLGRSGTVNIPHLGNVNLDFTGLGEADYQRQYADQLAREMLQLQRDYGPRFVEQRLRELEASDPTGAAMRRRLWSNIQQGASTPTDRSFNQSLEDRVLGDLGGGLDADLQREVSQGVLGGQVARGNYLGNAAATEEARALTGASEALRAQRRGAAMAFLTGGLAPQDAQYREQQQDLANLGAFLAGETPTAQFQQLTGAQQGAAPYAATPNLPGLNANAGYQGVQNAQQSFAARSAYGGVNPWLAGLTGAANGAALGLSFAGGGGNNGIAWAGRAPTSGGGYGPN